MAAKKKTTKKVKEETPMIEEEIMTKKFVF